MQIIANKIMQKGSAQFISEKGLRLKPIFTTEYALLVGLFSSLPKRGNCFYELQHIETISNIREIKLRPSSVLSGERKKKV